MKTENQAGRNLGAPVAATVDDVQRLLPSANLKQAATATKQTGGRAALNLAGRTLWYFPGRFGIARVLDPRCSLRCVIFHDVSDTESSLTRGRGVTITRSNFEAALRFLTRHYTPVSLQEVLTASDGRRLPPRPVLVTFDDAYASVAEFAAPLCRKFGVPAVFFVNAAFLDNQQLALDDLVCHVANVLGLGAINAAVRAVDGTEAIELRSLAQVFSRFLPAVSLRARKVFRDALVHLAQIREQDLAGEAGLYLTCQQLRDLAAFNFEIGNHTYTHVNCRSLSGKDLGGEIDRNKAVLEAISGRQVRSFSVPYGSSADLTPELLAHLQRTGHDAVFLGESGANPRSSNRFRLDRVSVKACSDAGFFSEIEVLPRLRTVRNWLFDTLNLGPRRGASHLQRVSRTMYLSGGDCHSTMSRERSDSFILGTPATNNYMEVCTLSSGISTLPSQVTTEICFRESAGTSEKRFKLMPDLAYEVEVDRASPAGWSAMLDLFHDANLYQTWSYGAVRWGTKNLSHLVLKRNGEVLGMAQLRIVRPTNFKFGMAYLRWGPLCHLRTGELDPDIVQFMATALRKEYVGKRRLYLEVMPNAFSGSLRGKIFQSAFAHFASKSIVGVNTYRTFVLDLSQPLEELRRKLNPKWRNKLNGAVNNSLKIIEGDGIEEYRTFCEIYTEMRTRKRFETSVNIEEFGRIQELLQKHHRMRVLICQHEGQPVSAVVCSAMGDSAIYLLGATNNAGLTLKGAYLLQWEMIRWLKGRGIRYYDLGGIDPEANPGVHSFKSGLSGIDMCHISPFVACDNSFSAAAVKAGQALWNFQLRVNSV